MPTRQFSAIILMALLSGCQAVEGTWEPDCAAYTGDRISLQGDRYRWDRFTDLRRVDEDGNVADPFPDYPKTGRYTLRGEAVELLASDGSPLAVFYLHERADSLLLLSEAEHQVVAGGGAFPDCPLSQTAPD